MRIGEAAARAVVRAGARLGVGSCPPSVMATLVQTWRDVRRVTPWRAREASANRVAARHADLVCLPHAVLAEQVRDAGCLAEVDQMRVVDHEPLAGALVEQSRDRASSTIADAHPTPATARKRTFRAAAASDRDAERLPPTRESAG